MTAITSATAATTTTTTTATTSFYNFTAPKLTSALQPVSLARSC